MMLNSVAMLTLFSSGDRYYEEAASSTVGTALTTGLPLLGPSRVLQRYSYLQPDNVLIVQEGESVVDCIERILQLSPSDLQHHFDSVDSTLNVLLDMNAGLFGRLVHMGAALQPVR